MKTNKFNFLTIALLMASLMFAIVSCNKDDDDDVVTKTALQTKITEATTLLSTTEEGTAEGQYLPGSKAILQSVIDAAQIVYDDPTSTQVEVDNTVIALDAAMDVYELNSVEAIAPEALVGHWTFDDGTGTTLTDYSGNGFNGTLLDGATTWGGSLPTWTTDRYGNAGGALMFDEGAHVEIPYNTALNPESMSIALWVNAAEVLENNRFMGMHSWNGFKFQLQSANKAFFTINASEGIYDRDSDPILEIQTWYHVTVTFGGGNMIFYVNGTQTQLWDNTPGTAVSAAGNNLVFGQDSHEYAATDANYDTDKIIPLAWGGYYHGAMDEVRIYNAVLTAAQVSSIYNLEKVVE